MITSDLYCCVECTKHFHIHYLVSFLLHFDTFSCLSLRRIQMFWLLKISYQVTETSLKLSGLLTPNPVLFPKGFEEEKRKKMTPNLECRYLGGWCWPWEKWGVGELRNKGQFQLPHEKPHSIPGYRELRVEPQMAPYPQGHKETVFFLIVILLWWNVPNKIYLNHF